MSCVLDGLFFFFKQKTAYEMRISDWSSDVCSSDLVVRSQRQDYLDTWLIGASDRLSSDAVALLEASLADPDSSTGFNRMKGDAGQATLDNILDVTEKLAFIQRLDLPHDLLTATGKPWVDQI